MQTLKFRQYDFIIYDVIADFGILFCMWNLLVMSYSRANIHHDITELIEFFMFFFVLRIFGQMAEISV